MIEFYNRISPSEVLMFALALNTAIAIYLAIALHLMSSSVNDWRRAYNRVFKYWSISQEEFEFLHKNSQPINPKTKRFMSKHEWYFEFFAPYASELREPHDGKPNKF